MIEKFQEVWKRWCEEGLRWPMAFDGETKKPSVTLLMFYFATVVMFSSVILLHYFQSIIVGTVMSVGVWIVGFVMYRMRKLDKFKFDLDDQEIELDSDDDQENGQKEDKESD